MATKIEAAAEAGYSTIFMPAALDAGGWAQGNALTAVAASRGVRLVPVHTIGEAYAAMTGRMSLQPDPSATLAFDPRVDRATRAVTARIVEALAQSIDAGSVPSSAKDYPREVAQASVAMTYLWLVSHAVASVQAYRVQPGEGMDDIDAQSQETMDATVESSWWFVESTAAELAAKGVDAANALWSSRWAHAQAVAHRESELATESALVAQGELWYDAVQVMMMSSAVNPTRISAVAS